MNFNQKAWLKPFIDINTTLGTETKSDFEKVFFKGCARYIFAS